MLQKQKIAVPLIAVFPVSQLTKTHNHQTANSIPTVKNKDVLVDYPNVWKIVRSFCGEKPTENCSNDHRWYVCVSHWGRLPPSCV